jgi:hypothetical protein
VPFGQPLLLAFLAGTAQTPPSPPPPPAPPATQGLPQAQPVTPTAPSSPAQAQPAPAEEIEEETEDEEEDAEIVVTGRRPLGAVIGDIPPEITLNPRDIRSYGASNLAELLDALSPQTRSGRGRGEGGPVVLLNGRRISGFGEIRDMPPEAIIRIDILPEEVALKYGYRADQRVVNFVLRPRFRAITGESEYGLATQGGRSDYEMEANILQVGEAGRWSLNANHRHSAPLFESERDVLGEPDPFRTLLPETDQYALNGTVNRNILDDVSATLNARFDLNESVSGLGLAEAEQRPLRRNSDRWNGHLGASLNGTLDPWRWTVTGNYDRSRSLTLTDVEREGAASIARDRAESVNQTANVELVANGPLFHLPAGNVSTSVRTGFELRDFTSGTIRGGIEQSRNLSRDRGSGQINLDFPIASRRNDFLGAIGSLSANFNAELEQLSDFGTLRTVGYGLNWSPITQINLIASVTDEDGAPSVQQLGDPVVLTPNVRVFDFVRGETVDIARIEGGNPELTADNRRVFKLGLNLRPLSEIDLSLSANYTKTRTVNLIASFPTATPEIEAAFPERFVRDDAGRLLRIDTRPVNFARSDREDMRWGINFSKALGPAGPPGGAGGRGERRFARGGGGAAGAEAQTGQRPGGATPPGAAAQGEARGPGARGPEAMAGGAGMTVGFLEI